MTESERAKPNDNTKGCAIGCLGLVALFLIIVLVSCSGSGSDSDLSNETSQSTPYVPSSAAAPPTTATTDDSIPNVSCAQYLGSGSTAQTAGARALLNGARGQQGISTPASSALVATYATQIAGLCSTSGYADLDNGAFEAAAAIYTASPEVWND